MVEFAESNGIAKSERVKFQLAELTGKRSSELEYLLCKTHGRVLQLEAKVDVQHDKGEAEYTQVKHDSVYESLFDSSGSKKQAVTVKLNGYIDKNG